MSDWYTNHTNEPIKHSAEHEKSETKEYTLYNTIYMMWSSRQE